MNRDLSLAEVYFGTAEPVPPPRKVSAGRWSALLVDGTLRDVRCDNVEVIRSIAFLVRDRDWGTCAPVVSALEIDEQAQAFCVRYQATCTNADGHRVDYRIEFSGDAERGIACRADGVAVTDFLTARCGFCVLHPIEGVAGAPAIVEHGDGHIESGQFPMSIDPWQPFKDIRTIEHRMPGGRWLRCALRGETFEMEDQRNWSDASFKTYSRPLALPWPYVLEAGQTVSQSVEISVRDEGGERAKGAALARTPTMAASTAPPALIGLDERTDAMPELGMAISADDLDAVHAHVDLLDALGVQRLSLHYDPTAGHDVRVLERYATLLRDVRIPATLEYALPGVEAPADEMAQLAREVRDSAIALAGLMVSPSVHRQSNPPGSVSPPCPSLEDVYASAREAFPGLRLSGGMLSYFTEFNRKRPPVSMVDEVVHATCPIVHAADDTSVMQTLEAVSHITRSCRALIGDRPYSIGPLSIAMRQNPYGSRTIPNPDARRVPMAADDPRQRGLFGAAWLVGYVAATAEARLASLSIGALTGPRGLLDRAGQLYPIALVVAVLGALGAQTRIAATSSRPRDVAVFAGHRRNGARVAVLANLTPDVQTFRLASTDLIAGHSPVCAYDIDETTFAEIRGGAAQVVLGALFDSSASTVGRVLTEGIHQIKPYGCRVLTF